MGQILSHVQRALTVLFGRPGCFVKQIDDRPSCFVELITTVRACASWRKRDYGIFCLAHVYTPKVPKPVVI